MTRRGLRSSGRRWVPVLCAMVCASLPTTASRAADEARIQRTVDRGVAFLKKNIAGQGLGYDSLSAYAMLKSGVEPDDPLITDVVARVRQKVAGDSYAPGGDRHGVYIAGCDVMLLEAHDAVEHLVAIEAIADYLIGTQYPEGFWYYPGLVGNGDTSISQYAVLGLWAAARAGAEIPEEVWDKAALWHMRMQNADGSSSYHPPGGGGTSTMTAAGVGSLCICRLMLFPDAESRIERKRDEEQDRKRGNGKRFGILETVDLDEDRRKRSGARRTSYEPKVQFAAITKSIDAGLAWLGANFDYHSSPWKMYFAYGVERAAALANVDTIGEHPWYDEGAIFLVNSQNKNGSWRANAQAVAGTSFALLFLNRATSKLLDRPFPRSRRIEGGLLIGGRGLPENLNLVELRDGEVKTRKRAGPLDDLLAEIEKPNSIQVEAAQAAIVEKVQLGDREALIAQKDRLLRLLKDPRVEVRRTAAWALGRTGDLRMAGHLIRMLRDPNLDVVIEARNALCILSRKPHGMGLADSPFEGQPEDLPDDRRRELGEAWREAALERWTRWYLTVRPYDERDDLLDAERKRR